MTCSGDYAAGSFQIAAGSETGTLVMYVAHRHQPRESDVHALSNTGADGPWQSPIGAAGPLTKRYEVGFQLSA
jgi:hypothetical protein